MSTILKSNQLVASAKRRAMLPSDDRTFSTTDILEIATEEMSVFGIQHLMSTHEDYLLTYEDVAIIDGTASYSLPERAIGNKLRDLQYISNSGNAYEMPRIQVEDIPDYNTTTFRDYPQVFYVQDNKVHIVEALPIDGHLRMYFYMRPNKLAEDKYAAVITDINRTTRQITVSNYQTSFNILPRLDFVQAKSPNKILNYDIAPTSIDSSTSALVFSSQDIPDDLVVGDYVNLATEAIVPQLPLELHPIIAQRVAVHCLEAMGDQNGVGIAQSRLKLMEASVLDTIDNRVEGAQQKVVNRHGPLRQSTMGDPRKFIKTL